MLEHLTPNLVRVLFQEASTDEEVVWIGNVFSVGDGSEVIPFQFLTTRYLMFFVSLPSLFGDQDLADEMVENWADGLTVHPSHRLIKFFRTDAIDQPDTLFDPTVWRLAHPRQIFQFSDLISDVVLLHVSTLPAIKEYYFKPENEQLERFYVRIFKRNPACSDAGFTPILELTGNESGFYGYTRH